MLMNKKELFSLVFFFLAIAGCDTLYGPVLRHDIKKNIDIEIFFINGDKVLAKNLVPCDSYFVGRGDREEDKIKKIFIYKNGQVIKKINSKEVEQMINKNKEYYGPSVWTIDRNGELKFLTGKQTKTCQPS